MKLTDREILELNELCGAVVDGTLTEAQRRRLQSWLRESEAVRRYYVRSAGQSASLLAYAGEIHADAPDRQPARVVRFAAWAGGALAAAAAVVLGIWILQGRGNQPAPTRAPAPSVARITGTMEARWSGARTLAPGENVTLGERLELQSGMAEVTFASGARVVLQGAAAMDVNSAWDATLRYGTLRATVPPEAIGFRVLNSAVEVLDLGTEFTVTADETGVAEVLVLKGEVEAAPRATVDMDTILLREHEARRFEASGVSPVADRERKLAQARQPVAFERYAATTRYLHWSFDEASGATARARSDGSGGTVEAATLTLDNVANPDSRRVEGRMGRALRFDGELQLRGRLAGLSSAAPHTIAFWVKVPEEAPLSDAYAMVAWATNLKQLGSRPVQISWNRRPAEGTLGALRTDFGGGCAIGTTSLRDGKWHHIAVLFSPGDSDANPVQVKQYVDGKLESSTVVPGRVRAPAGAGDAAVPDVLWLGCRLTGHQQRDHFRGDIDELFVIEGALEPDEVVRLARDNRLGSTSRSAVAQR